jgi:hypothetical protein
MIKYNNNTINDWFFSTDNIIKVYRNNAICYYKIDSSSPSGQTPCFAVVEDISQYSDTEFEDVYDKATEKWYKLNNLNAYEEYGVYGSGRTITTYEGKLTIDTESTPQPSRLPQGYTEVEYIRNSNYNAYIDTGVVLFDNTTNTYNITTKLTSEFHSNLGCATIIACENPISRPNYYGLGYRYKCSSTVDQLEFYGASPNYSASVIDNGDDTRDVIFQSTGNTSWTLNTPLIFFANWSSTAYTSTVRPADATIYSSTVIKNGDTVRDFVPAKRDSDSVYGLYDLITDTFYTSPNGNNFSGGSEVIPPPITTTYEYIYSGGSWVNLGEVSGSSKTSGFTILDIEGSGTTSSFGDGDYIVISYFNHNDPKTPSSMMSYKTQSGHNYQNDFSGHTGSNTITDNTIIDAAVWKLEVTSTANTYYIKNIDTNEYFGYQNTSVNNSFYLVDSANKAPILIDDYNGGIGLIEMKQAVSSYYGGYGLNQLYGYTYRCNWLNSGSGSKANFYTNDGNALYVLYQVNDGGGLEYPVEYTVMQDPPNNLVFSSMAEAEEYECPWVGMKATIDGDDYVFSGNSQSGYEWVVYSRLPVGYTEVEYITSENVSESVLGPYIDTNYKPTQNTRIVIDFQSTSSTREFQRIFGSGEFDMLGYLVNLEGVISNRKYYYKFGQTSSWYTTNVRADLNRHTIDYNNSRQFLLDNTSIATLPNKTFTCTSNLGIFWSINTKYITNNINLIGRVYSCQVYDNGTLVRDLVPCINPSSVVGMYDIVNDVFYSSANNYNFTAGNPI